MDVCFESLLRLNEAVEDVKPPKDMDGSFVDIDDARELLVDLAHRGHLVRDDVEGFGEENDGDDEGTMTMSPRDKQKGKEEKKEEEVKRPLELDEAFVDGDIRQLLRSQTISDVLTGF